MLLLRKAPTVLKSVRSQHAVFKSLRASEYPTRKQMIARSWKRMQLAYTIVVVHADHGARLQHFCVHRGPRYSIKSVKIIASPVQLASCGPWYAPKHLRQQEDCVLGREKVSE